MLLKVEELRAKAAEYEERAERTHSSLVRDQLIELAGLWRRMANEAERNSTIGPA